jgi:hypothetical protein
MKKDNKEHIPLTKRKFGGIPFNIWAAVVFMAVLLWFSICTEESDSRYIKSLETVDGTNGVFFLGSGSINSDVYYYYYVQEDEGWILERANARWTKIVERDEQFPQVIKYSCNCKSRLIGWEHNFDFFEKCDNPKTTLIVPPNTITVQYNTDIR